MKADRIAIVIVFMVTGALTSTSVTAVKLGRHHLGNLVDAGRVRVRHLKPAPRYAVCDGPGRDTSSITTPPQEDADLYHDDDIEKQ